MQFAFLTQKLKHPWSRCWPLREWEKYQLFLQPCGRGHDLPTMLVSHSSLDVKWKSLRIWQHNDKLLLLVEAPMKVRKSCRRYLNIMYFLTPHILPPTPPRWTCTSSTLLSLFLPRSPLLSCKVKSTPHGHNMETPSIMHPPPSGSDLNFYIIFCFFEICEPWVLDLHGLNYALLYAISPCRHTVWPCESRRRRRRRLCQRCQGQNAACKWVESRKNWYLWWSTLNCMTYTHPWT